MVLLAENELAYADTWRRAGHPYRAIAAFYNVNENTLRARLCEYRKSHSISPSSNGRTSGFEPEGGGSNPPGETKPTRHFIIPDCQIKPGVNIDHLKWCGEYIVDREPDVVICLGDFWDMESLSSYDKGKKSYEGRRYSEDILAGKRGMASLMEGVSKCKRTPRLVFLIGNHEQRIERAIESDAYLEGTIGYQDFGLDVLGWEVHEFLEPVEIDKIWYSHYWYTQNSGRPYTGAMETRIKNVGHSFVQGHQQGLQFGRRELGNATSHIGIVAGSFYQHEESYRGLQGNHHWRGVVVLNEVKDGDADPMFVSLDYLRRRYGN